MSRATASQLSPGPRVKSSPKDDEDAVASRRALQLKPWTWKQNPLVPQDWSRVGNLLHVGAPN